MSLWKERVCEVTADLQDESRRPFRGRWPRVDVTLNEPHGARRGLC